ncbi:hypothetical protein [Clostridium gasigenes]|uniref:Uncharacterized protein n=1 Tax=Clostridium gasigenes TaxID=94869 RepID=A0A1H0T5K7_9CLOT|nr:hypothetical protein [Clostridium gasigenes]MBB6623768.1 hypothetical protein [Clostridium gasigenes]MBU3088900.1 hypothetical protein [Clostridium gasigenes]SDP48776.1 hypothetical protein SAMN04488529_10657 [Clostridium gasigenes]
MPNILSILIVIFLFIFLLFITKKFKKSWLAYSIFGLELTVIGLSDNSNSNLFVVFVLLGFMLTVIGFCKSE